ncbi:MAG: tetratricopeptide repeat protein [Promethearchaeota archaeon]
MIKYQGQRMNINDSEKIRKECLGNFLESLENILEDQILLTEITEKIQSIKESKDLSEAIFTVIQASQKGRKQEKWTMAIKILVETLSCLLPGLETNFPLKDLTLLKIALLNELRDSFYHKGRLDKVGEILDELSAAYESIEDLKGKIQIEVKKANILLLKGEYTRSSDVLCEVLEHTDKISEEERRDVVPEIQRSLGVSYRGYGDYKKALEWFSKAMIGFKEIENDKGVAMTLWGLARLHELRGEWNKSIETYNLILREIPASKDIKDSEKKNELLMTYFDLYLDLFVPLFSSGDYDKAEEVLQKALKIAQELPDAESAETFVYINYSKLYSAKKRFFEALDAIKNAYSRWNKKKEKLNAYINEMMLLELETQILIEMDRQDEARKKLEAVFPKLKNEWDIATWYLVMGLVEKKDLNLFSAGNAVEKAITKAKSINHYKLTLTCQLMLTTLLIEKAKLGDQKALKQAKNQIEALEIEVTTKSMPAMTLELKILKAKLLIIQKYFNHAFQLLFNVKKEAANLNLNRQLNNAQNALYLLEQEQAQLKLGIQRSDNLQILKYLEEVRRIAGEGQ